MTPQQWVDLVVPFATRAYQSTGLDGRLFVTQWALETGWGTSDLFVHDHNLAGIRPHADAVAGAFPTGTFLAYSSLEAGFLDYLVVIHHHDYDPVRAAAGKPLWDQMVALGLSPWDAGHYDAGTGAAGVALGRLYDSLLKAIFEGEAPPAPPPAPAPLPVPSPGPGLPGLAAQLADVSTALQGVQAAVQDVNRRLQLIRDNLL